MGIKTEVKLAYDELASIIFEYGILEPLQTPKEKIMHSRMIRVAKRLQNILKEENTDDQRSSEDTEVKETE